TVFGRDITSDREIAYSREFVERERALCDRLRETLDWTTLVEAGEVDGPAGPGMLRALYEHHLTLKRWHWRVGLLRAVDGVSHDDVQRVAHEGGTGSAGPSPEKMPQAPAPVAPVAGR